MKQAIVTVAALTMLLGCAHKKPELEPETISFPDITLDNAVFGGTTGISVVEMNPNPSLILSCDDEIQMFVVKGDAKHPINSGRFCNWIIRTFGEK